MAWGAPRTPSTRRIDGVGALHRRYITQAIRERRERSEEADSRERRVALCIRELGLHNERDAMIGVAGDARRRGLSGGQRKRVAVAVELCGDPSALLLDEPTSGLDPNQVRSVRRLIRELAGEHTVLISSHILSEIEMTCDRVVILHEGRLLASGALNDLMAKANATVTAEMQAPLPEVQQWAAELALGQAEIAGQPDGYVRCQFAGAIDGSARERIFAAANERGWTLRELSRKAPSLEDLFVSLTQEKEEPQ